MKKNFDYDQEEQQFENFLKDMRAMKPLTFENQGEVHKNNHSAESTLKNNLTLLLEKQWGAKDKKLKKRNSQLLNLNQKATKLLERNEKYQQLLLNIYYQVKKYFEKKHIRGQNTIKSIINSDTGEIDTQIFQEYFLLFLCWISEEDESTVEQEKLSVQLKPKPSPLDKQLDIIMARNQELTQKYEQALIQIQKLNEISAQLYKKLQEHQKDERKYQQLIKNLDIKTKNRSQVILLFKGLCKKQRDHEEKCPLYVQQTKLSAKQLLSYEEERRKYFAEKKKSLQNVLNFM